MSFRFLPPFFFVPKSEDKQPKITTEKSDVNKQSRVKWVVLSHKEDVEAGYCECGQELDRLHSWEPAYLPNYCPNCGAKVVNNE